MSTSPATRAARRTSVSSSACPSAHTVELAGGATVYGLVLGSTNEDDHRRRSQVPGDRALAHSLAADYVTRPRRLRRRRGPARRGHRTQRPRPTRGGDARPDLPRRLGTYRGRRVRRWLEQLARPGRRTALRIPRSVGAVLGVPRRTAERRADRGRPRTAAAASHDDGLDLGALRVVR